MGIPKRPEKILVATDYPHHASFGAFNRCCSRLSSRSVYLHFILGCIS